MTSDKKSDINIKKFRKKEAFKVPENYFEEFGYKMQMKISSSKEEINWFDKMIYMLRLRFTVPFILVCFISLVVIQYDLDNPKGLVSDNAIEKYLFNELQNAHLEEFADLANLSFVVEESVINDNEIIEYLELIEIEDELLLDELN